MLDGIIDYFRNRFSMFVMLDRETSVLSLSRSLFREIRRQEKRKGSGNKPKYMASFWKIRQPDGSFKYSMFVNPCWNEHDVKNPNMVFKTPILIDPNGHMSVKMFMPTVDEILSVYNIGSGRARLSVSTDYINGDKFYVIEPH